MNKLKSFYTKREGKINLSKILRNNSSFYVPNKVKSLFTKEHLVLNDFEIKRAKPKVNIGKLSNRKLSLSFRQGSNLKKEDLTISKNIKDIPNEISDILDNNKSKSEKSFKIYYSLKKDNDDVLSYYHYMSNREEHNKKKKKVQIISNINDEEYEKTNNNYQLSNREQIELELQKKMSSKIFKHFHFFI